MVGTEIENVKSYLKDYLEMSGINTNRLFKCLNPSHNDSSPSMKFYDDNHVYCFGCNAVYDLIDVISICENVDKKEACKRALQYYGNPSVNNKQIHNILSTKKNINYDSNENKDYSKAYKYWNKILLKNEEAQTYLKNRNIDTKMINKFNLGYNEFHFKNINLKSIIIPINKNAFIARNIINTEELRYYKTKGSHADMFNKESLTNSNKYCFITEGEFDALSFESVGANALALSSVCNVNKFIEEEKNENKVFILALDNDKAGQNANDKLIDYFNNNQIKYKIFDNLKYKDANEALINDKELFTQKVKEIVDKIELKKEMC